MTSTDFANYLPKLAREARVTNASDLNEIEFRWHVLRLLCAIGEQVAEMNERERAEG